MEPSRYLAWFPRYLAPNLRQRLLRDDVINDVTRPISTIRDSGWQFVRAAPHGSVLMLLCFTAVIFFHFRQPNLGRLSTDLAEIWHSDRKLV